MEVHATVLIGTFMIINGLSFFLGQYPNEAKIFGKNNYSNLEEISSVYIYILLFLVLYFIGIFIVQKKINAYKNEYEEFNREDHYILQACIWPCACFSNCL